MTEKVESESIDNYPTPQEKPTAPNRSRITPGITIEQENSIALENRKWRHRRRMAYISLIAVIAQVVFSFIFILIDAIYGYVVIERLTDISTLLGTVNLGFISLVGAYFGFSTWKEK